MSFLRRHSRLPGFTLVELIVVITILAILATIAFLSFSGYSSAARDGVRLEDMNTIANGLSLYQIKAGNLPLPEGRVDITASGVMIGYQGYASGKTLDLISINPSGGKDPLDATHYTYSTNASQSKYQLLWFLENNDVISFFDESYSGIFSESQKYTAPAFVQINDTIASRAYADPISYSGRTVVTKGDTLGILLSSGSFVPVQAIGVSVDVVKTGTGYVCAFDAKNVTSSQTGGLLFSNIYNQRPDLLSNKSMAVNDPSLVGYWDMETMSGESLADLSQHDNVATLTGGISLLHTGRQSYVDFDGVDGYVTIPNTPALNSAFKQISIAFFIKTAQSTGNASIINRHTDGTNVQGSFRLENGKMDFIIKWNSVKWLISNKMLSDNVWHQVVGTYDGEVARIYIDGLLDKSVPLSWDIPSSSNPNYFGVYWSTKADYYADLLDDVRIYNRALSGTEVSALFASANLGAASQSYSVPPSVWSAADVRCTKADITIGWLVWAGCNSTLGTVNVSGVNQYAGVCNNYAGVNASTTDCQSMTAKENWSGITATAAYAPFQTDNIYGKLYRFDTDIKGAGKCGIKTVGGQVVYGWGDCPCPNGWHIPSDAEFITLESTLLCVAGDLSRSGWWCGGLGWLNQNVGGVSNNIVRALGLPLSWSCSSGSCVNRWLNTSLWSSTESSGLVLRRGLLYSDATVLRNTSSQTLSFSVRCVRDY